MTKLGFSFQASVGVEPLEHELVRPGERVEVNEGSLNASRGFIFVKHGRLREVSITPVGADAGVGGATGTRGIPCGTGFFAPCEAIFRHFAGFGVFSSSRALRGRFSLTPACRWWN